MRSWSHWRQLIANFKANCPAMGHIEHGRGKAGRHSGSRQTLNRNADFAAVKPSILCSRYFILVTHRINSTNDNAVSRCIVPLCKT
jgi:hypothetical protein